MPTIWYIAVEKFGPDWGNNWLDYTNWAQLPQLKELVSLDNILCPSVIEEFTDLDWQYNIKVDFLISCFDNVEYLLSRVPDRATVNVLAVIREPSLHDIQSFSDERFIFQGYDLIEQPGIGVSAISNCGGFDLAFKPTDISEVGLLVSYDYARIVQQRLLDNYPDEIHAYCYLWAIWKMKDTA